MSVLAGRRIVITRAPGDTGGLRDLLEARGAVPLPYPCIDHAPPADGAAMASALAALRIGAFDWLIFTSSAAASALSGAGRLPDSVRIAAIGSATAAAIRRHFDREEDFLPARASRESLATSLPLEPGQRILLPQSDLAPPDLADRLVERGACVRVVQAYRTIRGVGGVNLPHLLAAGHVDAITITSGSCAHNLHRRLREEGQAPRIPAAVLLACLGSGAADLLERELGYANILVARSDSQRGLVSALEDHYKKADARFTR